MFRQRTAVFVFTIVTALGISGCAGADPLAPDVSAEQHADDPAPLVIGSQEYYSSEIIAEIYAQVLENGGYAVDRQFRIGQREVYLPEIEAGSIDLFPEYTGPLLEYWNPHTTARLSEPVYAELAQSTPEGLRVLDQAAATDQNSYTVTKEFAQQWELASLGDLTKVTVPLTLGANSEAQTRPNGPPGLLSSYGVSVDFTPIEDGGGPLTVKALKDDSIQLAIIYTADPSIARNGLVSLTDTEGLFLASHVVPLASSNVDEGAAEIINQASAQLSAQDLVALNARSVDEELPAATIASDWIAEQGL